MQSICELPQPEQLEWNITSGVQDTITTAVDNIDRYGDVSL